MMITRCLRAAALVGVLFVFTACTGRTYTMAQVDLDPSRYERMGEAEIKTTGLMLFSLIPIQQTNKIERAANYIIEQKGGDDLVNISVTESWFWAYVLNGYQVTMSGTVVKKK
jgi:hypothetical protein